MPCHHLAFEQATIDWQIWIDAGAEPLPRKLVIAYKTEDEVPQYSVTIRKWKLDPKLPDELFRFEPPEGAQRVEIPAFARERPRADRQPADGDGQAGDEGRRQGGGEAMRRESTAVVTAALVVFGQSRRRCSRPRQPRLGLGPVARRRQLHALGQRHRQRRLELLAEP